MDYCIGDLKRSNGFDLFDNQAGIEVSNTDDVKRVIERTSGRERIISPIESIWDHFFLNGPAVSDDLMNERGLRKSAQREEL